MDLIKLVEALENSNRNIILSPHERSIYDRIVRKMDNPKLTADAKERLKDLIFPNLSIYTGILESRDCFVAETDKLLCSRSRIIVDNNRPFISTCFYQCDGSEDKTYLGADTFVLGAQRNPVDSMRTQVHKIRSDSSRPVEEVKISECKVAVADLKKFTKYCGDVLESIEQYAKAIGDEKDSAYWFDLRPDIGCLSIRVLDDLASNLSKAGCLELKDKVSRLQVDAINFKVYVREKAKPDYK